MATNQPNLNDCIEKLKIESNVNTTQRTITVSDIINPFSFNTNLSIVDQNLFGPKCECGHQNDKSQFTATPKPRKSFSSLHLRSKFKNSIRHRMIREPILKIVGKCMHNNLTIQQQILSDMLTSERNLISALNLEDKPNKLQTALPSNAATNQPMIAPDFRILNSKYSKLSLYGNNLGDKTNYSRKCFKLLRPSKLEGALLPKNQLNQKMSNIKLETDVINSNVASVAAQPQPSCSQQAMQMNGNNCDVNVDEIASYFETLVYIPKKMSTMAEMMYI